MWEAISDIVRSPNVSIIVILLVFLVLLGVVMVRSGMLNVHTDSVQVGAATRERDIMRQQIEWCRMHFQEMEHSMPKPDNYNEWRGRYVAERVFDEYVEWITFNHFSKSPAYIEIKQDKIVALVRSLTVLDYFHDQEFEDFLRQDTKNCIEKLIQIRMVYR
jgi:hypothetical protein